MSRTFRIHPKTKRIMRDGSRSGKPSRGCERNNSCSYCRSNRLHNSKRQKPLE